MVGASEVEDRRSGVVVLLWSRDEEDGKVNEDGEEGVERSGVASRQEIGLGERERCCALGEVEVDVLPAR